jgi:hypothetical protein
MTDISGWAARFRLHVASMWNNQNVCLLGFKVSKSPRHPITTQNSPEQFLSMAHAQESSERRIWMCVGGREQGLFIYLRVY